MYSGERRNHSMKRTRASPSTSSARNSMNQADDSAMIAGWVLPLEIVIFMASRRSDWREDFGNARRRAQDIFWRFHGIRPIHLQPPALNNLPHGAKPARSQRVRVKSQACARVHRVFALEQPGQMDRRLRGFLAPKRLLRRPPTPARSSGAPRVDESHG